MNLVASVFRIPIFFRRPGKYPLSMRCLLPLLVTLLLSTKSFAQQVTLSLNNADIETAFKEIKKQTGYNFIYTRDQLEQANKVTVAVVNKPLEAVLELCFKNQPLTYHIEDKYVIVRDKAKTTVIDVNTVISISGKVTDDKGIPLAGATVVVKQTGRTTMCVDDGTFSLTGVDKGSVIVISNVGFESREIKVNSEATLNIQLIPFVNSLDETLVIAYGTTTKKLNTGSVSKVSKEEIERQPVNNVLATLHGRVPGLTVVQQNGVPGSDVKIQIRGRTSINESINNDPLIIIDGVPFAPNNTPVSLLGSSLGTGGLSAFNTINPADIESIEVLKDADATAIYGSRGANGVILITTRKGKEGKTTVNASFRSGFSKITRMMSFLNTPDYLKMRREAFANDGITPNATVGTPGYAPDLMIWDTTRYTDFKKLLIGGTAKFTDVNLSVSGGNSNTQFLVGSSYSRQTTVFPGDLSDNRGFLHANINHRSANSKFNLNLKTSYGYNQSNITSADVTTYLKLPPNLPSLYDSAGKLNWQYKGVNFDNPLAQSLRAYETKTDNFLAGLDLSYQVVPGVFLKLNSGINSVSAEEINTTPIASQNPASAPLGSVSFGNSKMRSFIIEPQVQLRKKFQDLRVDWLVGSTYQSLQKQGTVVNGSGYANDALLRSLKSATTVTIIRSDNSSYKYAALFSRMNFNMKDRYLLNISGRRDGSSRFGPGKQFANFGAVGMGWIFSNESFAKKALPFVSYGKLRASYGTTGNDKIGDYAYLNTYSSTGVSYQGTAGTIPSSLFNPDYAWELNKKFEAAVEANFLKDKLQFTLAYFLNTCSNQLINYSLPSQTGALGVIANFPAKVQNSGWEIEIGARILEKKLFKWTTSFNISIPKNELVSFPGFSNSSYASYLVIGQPLNLIGGYRSAGVNPTNGLFQFYNQEGKETSTPSAADRVKDLVNLEPIYYGGVSQSFEFKRLQFDLFFEFRKQQGANYIRNIYSSITYPGMMFNQPTLVMNRWTQPGDITEIQKFTTRSGTPAYAAANIIRLNSADNQYSDASYIRLKNLSVSYNLPEKVLSRIGFQQLNIFLEAQNLITLTRFKGSDPETQDVFRLPLLRTLVFGIKIKL